MIFLLIDMREFDEGRSLIAEFSRYYEVKTIPNEMISYFENYLTLKLESFANNVDFLRKFIPRSIGLLDQYKEELNDTQIDEWYQNLVISLIEIQDYKVAMSILHEWLSEEKRLSNNIYKHFLRLICYFESGANLLAQNEIRSCHKFMKSKKLESITMNSLIKYIQASIKKPDEEKAYKKVLQGEFDNYRNSKVEKKHFLNINLWNWACQ